mgnify:CR=1 FL=1
MHVQCPSVSASRRARGQRRGPPAKAFREAKERGHEERAHDERVEEHRDDEQERGLVEQQLADRRRIPPAFWNIEDRFEEFHHRTFVEQNIGILFPKTEFLDVPDPTSRRESGPDSFRVSARRDQRSCRV